MQKLQKEAQIILEQRRVRCDLELHLEASLNDEDLKRMESLARAEGIDREARYMKLFADFQTQKTHLVRALSDVRDMRKELEVNEAERARMGAANKSLEVCAATSGGNTTGVQSLLAVAINCFGSVCMQSL
jgi:hypothetical protein